MSSRSPRSLITVLGIVVSAAFVWAAVRHLDTEAVARTWRAARPLPWVVVGALVYTLGHCVRGARLRFLVRREAKLPLLTASNVVVVGYAANNVLPARLGELVRAGMLAERTGMPLAQALVVTFIERLLDGLAILFLLVATSFVVRATGWTSRMALVGAAVFGVALLVLALAIVFPRTLTSLASRLAQSLGSKGHDRVMSLATSVVNGAAALRAPGDALILGTSSVAIWLVEALMFFAVLPALGLPQSIGVALIAMSATNLGILVPSTPGYVGPFHFFCAQALMAFGIGAEIALGYAVLVHLCFFVPATVWGAGAMLWYGVEVGSTAARARAARRSPELESVEGVPLRVIARLEPARAVASPSAFDVALTEALLPGRVEPEVRDEVARFVTGQLRALPSQLRLLYGMGMGVFRLWVRLRYLGGFSALALERRREAVSSWADARFAPLGQLFRAPRSTALLAFYDGAKADGD